MALVHVAGCCWLCVVRVQAGYEICGAEHSRCFVTCQDRGNPWRGRDEVCVGCLALSCLVSGRKEHISSTMDGYRVSRQQTAILHLPAARDNAPPSQAMDRTTGRDCTGLHWTVLASDKSTHPARLPHHHHQSRPEAKALCPLIRPPNPLDNKSLLLIS